MGYRIGSRDTSSTWSLRILLVVIAVVAGLLGMHVFAGHGTPTASAVHAEHHRSTVLVADAWTPMVGAPAGEATAMPTSGHGSPTASPAHGCADCAEHTMAASCVLGPVVAAALTAPPVEDLRPAPAVSDSAVPVAAEPRPPRIVVLCISRR